LSLLSIGSVAAVITWTNRRKKMNMQGYYL
jgi:hypothetical protein